MEETDIIKCQKKKKDEKNIKKIVVRLQSLNLVINKIAFHYINLIVHGNHALLGFYCY